MAKQKSSFLFGSAVLFAAVCAVGLSVFSAQRKVTIFKGDKAGVILQNGSTVAVNYDVLCYNKAGAPSFTMTNKTLAAKASISYPKLPICNNGSTGSWGSGTYEGGPVQCTPYVNYASAASVCGTGYTLCSPTQYIAHRTAGGNAMSGWYNVPAGYGDASGSWQHSYDGGGTWSSNYDGYVPGPSYNSSELCTNGSSTISFCAQNYFSSSNQSLCCPSGGTFGAADSCEVTVNTPDGYLQSPQFKGGAPF